MRALGDIRSVSMLILIIFALTKPSRAHDEWTDRKAVPAWVKSSCCGPSDAHHLKRQHVHAMADGWHIDGYPTVVPYGKELPSEDGEYRAFFKRYEDGSWSPVYCLFVPPQSY